MLVHIHVLVAYVCALYLTVLPSTSFTPPLHIVHPSPPHPSPLPSHPLHPPPPLQVDVSTFLTMTEEDLKEIGVSTLGVEVCSRWWTRIPPMVAMRPMDITREEAEGSGQPEYEDVNNMAAII